MLSFIDMKKSLLAVQVLLLVLVLSSLAGVAAWVLSPQALGVIDGSNTPSQWQFVNAVMNEPVDVEGPAGVATASQANAVIGDLNEQEQPGAAEFYGNEAQLSFWAPTLAQESAWVAVRAVPLAGSALIWWLLLTIVRRVGREDGFSGYVVTRLRLVGLLVMLGTPACIVARWGVASWLVETSSANEIANAAPLYLPWWPIALGVVVLVVAHAWRQAATMREDLAGLV
jgi:hypothetical protein